MKACILLALTVNSGVYSTSVDLAKKIARARLEKSGLPDPVCRTGIISLPIASLDKKQACCPSYCKECNDYKTCESVRGQASKDACCASNVVKMECGKGAPANVCLKKCSEALPPCIMEDGQVWKLEPPKVNAAEDCNHAVVDWRTQQKAAIKAGEESSEAFEAKMTLKSMDDAVETHSKLVDKASKTVESIKKTHADADDAISNAEDIDAKLDKEMEKADDKTKAKIQQMKDSLKKSKKEAEDSKKELADAVDDLHASKKDLDDKLKKLEGHSEAAKTDPKHVLDKKSDLHAAHEAAKKATEHHAKVEHHEGIVKRVIHAVVDVCKDIAHFFHW